jgi:hypothetical protein
MRTAQFVAATIFMLSSTAWNLGLDAMSSVVDIVFSFGTEQAGNHTGNGPG